MEKKPKYERDVLRSTRLQEALNLLRSIKWRSCEKDNMEFDTKTTYWIHDRICEILKPRWESTHYAGESNIEYVDDHIYKNTEGYWMIDESEAWMFGPFENVTKAAAELKRYCENL